MQPMIQVRQMNKSFADHHVLKDITFQVNPRGNSGGNRPFRRGKKHHASLSDQLGAGGPRIHSN